ncbi:MAG: hypothetical protein ACK5PZ_06675, partial [Pirellula sp.]
AGGDQVSKRVCLRLGQQRATHTVSPFPGIPHWALLDYSATPPGNLTLPSTIFLRNRPVAILGEPLCPIRMVNDRG